MTRTRTEVPHEEAATTTGKMTASKMTLMSLVMRAKAACQVMMLQIVRCLMQERARTL